MTPRAQTLLDTRDLDEASTCVGASYCPHELTVTGHLVQFHAVQTEALLGEVAVHQLSYGSAVQVEPVPLGNWVLVSAPLRGALTIRSGRAERTLAVGDSVAIDSYRPFSLSWESGCRLQTIRLPRHLVQEAGESAGVAAGGAVRLGLGGPITPTAARSWQAVAALVRQEATEGGEFTRSPLLTAQLTRMLATALVGTYPVVDADEGGRPGNVLPRGLRRALELVEREPETDLSVAVLAAAASLSPRALQEGFRKHLDLTPTEFVRSVRMARAHEALAQADPHSGKNVAQIAYQWGFGNLGRFARDYQRRYGQLPSTTLRT
ncbi:AraC family transcriptional regulator [Streptomyces sp. GbtcB6]|uniref:AraC family transcriptional regulator n=1 Tax=Streptomyces sp. GbtcB6 TaxID=2824751 RepID=UPI001C30400A|nr:AraC family transcriptional regulator [Streptomyces sp. GbtcB6]